MIAKNVTAHLEEQNELTTEKLFCDGTLTDLYSGFCEPDSQCHLLPHKDVRIVGLGERSLQLVELGRGEAGPVPFLFQRLVSPILVVRAGQAGCLRGPGTIVGVRVAIVTAAAGAVVVGIVVVVVHAAGIVVIVDRVVEMGT